MTRVNLGPFGTVLEDGMSVNSVAFTGPPEQASGLALASVRDRAEYRASLVFTLSEMPVDQGDLAQYAGNELEKLRLLPAFQHHDMQTLELEDGTAAIIEHHQFEEDGGLLIEQYQLYVALEDGRALVGTASHLAGDLFEAWAERFRRMLLTVLPL